MKSHHQTALLPLTDEAARLVETAQGAYEQAAQEPGVMMAEVAACELAIAVLPVWMRFLLTYAARLEPQEMVFAVMWFAAERVAETLDNVGALEWVDYDELGREFAKTVRAHVDNHDVTAAITIRAETNA